MELSGSYIPPGYACQWKLLTADSDYAFYLHGKVLGKDILRETDFVKAFNMSLITIPSFAFGLKGEVKYVTGTILSDES